MGNAFSRKESRSSTSSKRVMKSSHQLDNQLAPKEAIPCENEENPECPICFLNFKSLNTVSCCNGSICTTCYISLKSSQNISICPFCTNSSYTAIHIPIVEKENISRGNSSNEKNEIKSQKDLKENLSDMKSFSFSEKKSYSAPVSSIEERNAIENEIRNQHQSQKTECSHNLFQNQNPTTRRDQNPNLLIRDLRHNARVNRRQTTGNMGNTSRVNRNQEVPLYRRRNDEMNMLEEIMLHEAIRLSMLDAEREKSPAGQSPVTVAVGQEEQRKKGPAEEPNNHRTKTYRALNEGGVRKVSGSTEPSPSDLEDSLSVRDLESGQHTHPAPVAAEGLLKPAAVPTPDSLVPDETGGSSEDRAGSEGRRQEDSFDEDDLLTQALTLSLAAVVPAPAAEGSYEGRGAADSTEPHTHKTRNLSVEVDVPACCMRLEEDDNDKNMVLASVADNAAVSSICPSSPVTASAGSLIEKISIALSTPPPGGSSSNSGRDRDRTIFDFPAPFQSTSYLTASAPSPRPVSPLTESRGAANDDSAHPTVDHTSLLCEKHTSHR